METSNTNLELLIMIRRLSEGLKSNWETLNSSKLRVAELISEAKSLLNLHGTDIGKAQFKLDTESLEALKETIESQLSTFRDMMDNKSNNNYSAVYADFERNTEAISSIFARIAKYSDDHFHGINSADWFGIWAVIQSNVFVVQQIGHSAYVQLGLIESFNKAELDLLTVEIVKYIPSSFNIVDALQYKKDYLIAVSQMAEEANKKDNLWDRFLNFLAGNIPFKQTPQERVMMMRWLDGDKGEL